MARILTLEPYDGTALYYLGHMVVILTLIYRHADKKPYSCGFGEVDGPKAEKKDFDDSGLHTSVPDYSTSLLGE